MNWYKNKRIVLTGATSGIGLLLLEKLLHAGAMVVAVGRNVSGLKSAPGLFPYACDVSQPENIDALFAFAVSRLGQVDVFFANAGFGYHEQLDRADWQHIDNIFRTNVYSPLYTLEKMIEHSRGRECSFVITSSGVAQTPLAGFALYTATKFAVDGFSQAMQLELPGHVHLTTVYPVAMKTRFFDRSGPQAPMPPFFRQRPQTLVNKMFRGVARQRKYIRPMPIFNLTVWFMAVFPFVKTLALRLSARWMRR